MRNYVQYFKQSMHNAFIHDPDGNAQSRRNAVAAGTMEAIVLSMTTGVFYTGLILNVLESEPLSIRNNYLGWIIALSFLARTVQVAVPFIIKKLSTWRRFYQLTRGSFYLLQCIVMVVLLNLPLAGISKANGILMLVFLSEMLFFLSNPLLCEWYISNVPKKTHPDWFSGQQLLVTLGMTISVILASFVLDRFEAGGYTLLGIFVLRLAALIPGFLEFRANKRIKLPPIKSDTSSAPKLKQVILSICRNKKYLSNLILTCLFGFVLFFPGQYFVAYLLDDINVSYTFINIMMIMSIPMLMLAMPLWLRLVHRLGWYTPFCFVLLIYAIVHITFGFVIKEVIWLYIAAMVVSQFAFPGANLISGALPFQDMQEGMEAAYLAVYNVTSNLFRFLGAFAGKIFMSVVGEKTFNVFGLSTVSGQYICFICAAMYVFTAGIAIWIKRLKYQTK